jgi:hypothetical protein
MSDHPDTSDGAPSTPSQPPPAPVDPTAVPARPVEVGGRTKGLEPTRYGDWEKDGRCIDF